MKQDESEILDRITNLVLEAQKRASQKGVEIFVPRLEVRDKANESYSTEVIVEIRRGEIIIDWIECHIYRMGRRIATPDEFVNWLSAELTKVLEKC